MKESKRAYLIDFDNTLFDTDALKRSVSENFKKRFGSKNLSLFWKTYAESVKTLKYVDIKEISKDLSKNLGKGSPKDFEDLFLKADFKKFVFRYSNKLIKTLMDNGKVILYSLGDSHYQPTKIKGSGIEKLIGKENVLILKNKKIALGGMILKLKASGYNQIIMVDDRADFLEKAKRIEPGCITVWFRFGKYGNTLPKDKLSIIYETDIAENLIHYLKNLVGTLPQRSIKENVSILREISKPQIEQLIHSTGKDKLIKKFTHDKERFNSFKTFASWKRRGKNIYVMVGRRDKLLGIIWFSGKAAPTGISKPITAPVCRYTFAIRNYPPARRKGLSPQFMYIVFKDFGVGRKKGIWLSTAKDNIPANKLYTNYGFKKIADSKEDRIIYTFTG